LYTKIMSIIWFSVTNVLKKNTMIVWESKACLYANVNCVRKIPRQSITSCQNP
jgi:hypothetical protein